MNLKHMMGAAIIGMLLLTACGKKAPSYAKYIPKDAGYVVALDVQSMMVKLQKDSLSIDNMMDAFKDSSADYAKAVSTWKDFKDAGVDFSNKIFVTFSTSGISMMGGGNTSFEMVGGLKDAAKLEAFIKKQPHFGEIKKGDGFSYAGENDMMVGWNDDAVIMVGTNENKYANYNMDDRTGAAPRSQSNAATASEKLKKYFKLEKAESMASVDAFADLMGKKADISMYNSANLSSMPAMITGFVPKLKDLLEGTYSTSLINFDDGKADIQTTGYLSEKMAELIKKYPSNDVDMGMLENYPSSNVDGLMLMSFNPKLIPELVKAVGADAIANVGLANAGLNLDEVGSIFKGDFAFAVSDFTMIKKDYGNGMSMPSPSVKIIFSAKIGNKGALDKVIALGEKQGMVVRQGDRILVANNGVPLQGMPYAISLANDAITIASDSALLTTYLAKTQKIGLSDDVKSKLKSTSAAFYVDMEKIFTGMGTSMFDSTDMEGRNSFEKAKATFKDGWFTAGNFDGKKSESKGELVFVDPKKNSLSQIVNFAIYAGQQQKAKSTRQAAEYPKDNGDVIDSALSMPKVQ